MYKRRLQLCMRYAQEVVNVQETPAAVYEICSGVGNCTRDASNCV